MAFNTYRFAPACSYTRKIHPIFLNLTPPVFIIHTQMRFNLHILNQNLYDTKFNRQNTGFVPVNAGCVPSYFVRL